MSLKVNRDGSAIVIVLGIVAVLMIMAVAFSVIMRTERAGTTNLRHNLNARNGLQTAISQALYDIDESIGDNIRPKKWVNGVMTSKSGDERYKLLNITDKTNEVNVLSILNEKSRKHLNPTSRALLRNAKVDWRLIYGGVSLSNYANKDDSGKVESGSPLNNDTINGRIAYAVVNQTGYLDPNMVSSTHGAQCLLPVETHQLKNNAYAYSTESNKQIAFIDKNLSRININKNLSFFKNREKRNQKDPENENRFLGFTSFADLVRINEREKGKMFINLYDPSNPASLGKNKGSGGANRLFLPDVFGPATFGMSPYPQQVKWDGYDDEEVLTQAIPLNRFKKDGKEDSSFKIEEHFKDIHLAFKNIFARKNWIEKDSYGSGKNISFGKVNVDEINVDGENIYGEIYWDIPSLARGGLNRSDLALLALAEYVYYKKNGPKWDGKYEAYINEIVKILGPSKIPSKGGVLNAPCFKPVPLVSSIIGWTEIPEEDGKIYLKTGENSFQEKGDEVIIPADQVNSIENYYKKYELPMYFSVSFANLYKNTETVNVNGNIKLVEMPDEDDIVSHINNSSPSDEKRKVFVDPKSFESVEVNLSNISVTSRKSIIDREPSEKIVVYVQFKSGDVQKSEDDGSKRINNETVLWTDAGFDTGNLKKYSINVEAEIEVLHKGIPVQQVPAPGYRSSPAITFMLPLYRDNFSEDKIFHRVGYAMAVDPRFALATKCLHDYRDAYRDNNICEDFPFWVNNDIAEEDKRFKKRFNALEDLEKNIEDPTELIPSARGSTYIANPYARLAMGFSASDDKDLPGDPSAFWKGIVGSGVAPFPDTLHKIPGTGTYLTFENSEYDDKSLKIDYECTKTGIENLAELGKLCIGPWETISLFSTETPNEMIDFHTVFDYFTLDEPSKLLPGKVNLNAPPLLGTHPNSSRYVKLAMDFKNDEKFEGDLELDMGVSPKVSPEDYIDKTNGINPEPLMAVIYSLGFDYNTSWEIASRILNENIFYGSNDGINCFKDISQLGYIQTEYSKKTNDSLLQYLIDNKEKFESDESHPIDVLKDCEREKLLGNIAKYVTTRGQTFTIAVRSDAFAPKYGSDVEGTTLASKVAIVEAWRDTEPVRDTDGNIIPVKNADGEIIGVDGKVLRGDDAKDESKMKKYHNWHIRSVRIID